ncbi:MAG: type I restriction endonuclease [Candidatus Poribacteria bacterium]|nr:type I restriction endonuclease [Candidatus Poribacteria bacterium]
MTLKEHIEDIRNQLKQGAYPSEAAVSFGIVQRLLEPLGWPKFTPQVIIPEYAVEGQRVDFALCHPPGKPLVFIEVKQVGNLEGAEEQLFGYAFRRGVPIAILTDGQKWRFFYPIGQGDFRERKVYELDLIENDSEENSARLNRYLNYEAVQIGEAVKAIEEDYKNVSKQRQIERRLPEAWSQLLRDEDEFSEFLLEVMIGKTESLCGARPATEQVLTFLKSLQRKTESDRKASSSNPEPNPRSRTAYRTSSTTRKPQQTLIVTMPDGTKIDHHNAAQTFVEVIVQEVIEKLSPEEVSRIYPTIISTTPFPPDKAQQQHGQFHINLKNGTPAKKLILEKIAKRLDIHIKVDVVDKQ